MAWKGYVVPDCHMEEVDARTAIVPFIGTPLNKVRLSNKEEAPVTPPVATRTAPALKRERVKTESLATADAGPSRRALTLKNEQNGISLGISKFHGSSTVERERVLSALQTFEDMKHNSPGDRPGLVGQTMRLNGQWLNRGIQYIGHVPGVEVGDSFRFRTELQIIGLHNSCQAGIAWVSRDNKWGVPVANSIVVSGGYYANQVEDGNSFIYIGSGSGQKDQVLKRGNLALANSFKLLIPVRVIKKALGSCKAYHYDGLYLVTGFWEDTNDDGFLVYKYRMKPCNGQPVAIPKVEHARNLKNVSALCK